MVKNHKLNQNMFLWLKYKTLLIFCSKISYKFVSFFSQTFPMESPKRPPSPLDSTSSNANGQRWPIAYWWSYIRKGLRAACKTGFLNWNRRSVMVNWLLFFRVNLWSPGRNLLTLYLTNIKSSIPEETIMKIALWT